MENPALKGMLPKQYVRQNLYQFSLGILIDLIATSRQVVGMLGMAQQ